MKTWRTLPWLSAAICVMAVLVFIGGRGLERALILERDAGWVASVPRLWSCHWVHVGWQHLLLNLAAGGIAFAWLELSSRRLAWLVLVVTGPCVALAALMAMPEISRYCGLSGVIHGAAGALIALGFFRGQARLAAGMFLAIGLKLALEFQGGRSLFLGEGAGERLMISTPISHLCGLLVGLVTGLMYEGRMLLAKKRATECPQKE